jgi:hypothetical protein
MEQWGHWDLNPDRLVAPMDQLSSDSALARVRPSSSADPLLVISITGASNVAWLHHVPGATRKGRRSWGKGRGEGKMEVKERRVPLKLRLKAQALRAYAFLIF